MKLSVIKSIAHLMCSVILLLAIVKPQDAIADGASNLCDEQGLTIDRVPDGASVRFFVTTNRLAEATITFDCHDLVNLAPSHPLPYTFNIDRPVERMEFMIFKPISDSLSTNYGQGSTQYQVGMISNRNTINYLYSLPYSPREQHPVVQSYFGTYSHQANTNSAYAVDFSMPEGTTILAARPGTVVKVRVDSNRGGASKDYENCANTVVIAHGDGTYAEYMHLKQNGALVALRQQVNAGTPIGLSGKTGFVSAPHLHFAVFRVKSSNSHESIPFQMRTKTGVVSKLETGHIY